MRRDAQHDLLERDARQARIARQVTGLAQSDG
jgi:hypothetical protein